MGEDVDKDLVNYSRSILEETIMYKKNVLDANSVNSNFACLPFASEDNEIDYTIIFNNGSSWSKRVEDNKREYTKFLDYKGKNLIVSREELSIRELKMYTSWANKLNVEGKVVEVDKGKLYIIGDYISKDQKENCLRL